MRWLDYLFSENLITQHCQWVQFIFRRKVRCYLHKWGLELRDIAELVKELDLKSPIRLSIAGQPQETRFLEVRDEDRKLKVYFSKRSNMLQVHEWQIKKINYTYQQLRMPNMWWIQTAMKVQFISKAKIEVFYFKSDNENSRSVLVNMMDCKQSRKCLMFEYKKMMEVKWNEIEQIILDFESDFLVQDAEEAIKKKVTGHVSYIEAKD